MFWCLRWRVCLIYCSSANNYLFGPSLVFFCYICVRLFTCFVAEICILFLLRCVFLLKVGIF